MLVVRAPDSPFQTLEDLVTFAKENPQSLTVGGSGTFSGNHLETLRMEQLTEADVTYIPIYGYRGPLPSGLVGGA